MELLELLQSHYSSIGDHTLVRFECHLDIDIKSIQAKDICNENLIMHMIIIILVIVSTLLLLIAMVLSYKETIKIHIFSHPWARFLISEEALDKDKIYDVFISYAHQVYMISNYQKIFSITYKESFYGKK